MKVWVADAESIEVLLSPFVSLIIDLFVFLWTEGNTEPASSDRFRFVSNASGLCSCWSTGLWESEVANLRISKLDELCSRTLEEAETPYSPYNGKTSTDIVQWV